MNKAMIGTLSLLGAVFVPASARAQVGVSVSVGVPLPPPIAFSAPPELVVIPETYVYAVPDVEADIFFSRGWWWRPWEGRWYRSRHFDRGWGFYGQAPPRFYRHVPPGWRNDYREGRFRGREWKHERIRHGDLQRNWRGWERDKHWHQHDRRGVRGMEPRPVGPRGSAHRMEPRPEGRMQMRGPQPATAVQPQHRGFRPGRQGPHGGGPMGGPQRGPGPGRGNHGPGGHGRR